MVGMLALLSGICACSPSHTFRCLQFHLAAHISVADSASG